MVFFSSVERASLLNCGILGQRGGLAGLSGDGAGSSELSLVVIKYGGAILGRCKSTRHWVVHGEEAAQHLLYGNLSGIERDAQCFRVVANTLVGRVEGRPAAVADDRLRDPREVSELLLGMPESSEGEGECRGSGRLHGVW